jgi:hypothetical protein
MATVYRGRRQQEDDDGAMQGLILPRRHERRPRSSAAADSYLRGGASFQPKKKSKLPDKLTRTPMTLAQSKR